MIRSRNARLFGLVAALGLAFSMVAVDHADARRGGSFGSRGARTYQSAPATNTAPAAVAPVQRTMTQPSAARPNAAANAARPGFMNGFGGSLMRGLMLGGLLGLLFGGGFGGLAGMLGLIVQVALIALAVMLLMRFLRSRSSRSSQPAAAGAPNAMHREAAPQQAGPIPGIGSRLGGGGGGMRRPTNPDELGISNVDLDVFERRLTELQYAYGREDYATLRKITTPEMMSYLSEELGQNASRGLVNEVRDVKLLQGDVAESWREGRSEYATVAMRFSSIETTRERSTGRVVEGDADHATEATELWTFVREDRGDWLLSAIQEA